MKDKVTIVIPAFNQGQYLPACVDHCLFQTYPNLEIIIVDGGSTDNTKEYLDSLGKKFATQSITPVDHMDESGKIVRREVLIYPQNREIKIIKFDKDIGATQTYNEGFKRATGKYCTYIVGDDIPHPHMIEELVLALENTDSDFVYSDMNLVDDSGRIIRQMRMPDYDFQRCFCDWFHLGVSKLYRTELHNTVGIMDESWNCANDYDHYLRFAMAGATFHHLPRILYSIRYHGENRKTGQHAPKRYKRLLEECRQCAFRARKFLFHQDVEAERLIK